MEEELEAENEAMLRLRDKGLIFHVSLRISMNAWERQVEQQLPKLN